MGTQPDSNMQQPPDINSLKIAFIHPDLGIGGAERLVVDAACGLQQQGHRVKIFTSHCDLNHCFEEVKNGTLKVQVFGDHLPTNYKNKFHILFANLRQLYLIYQLHQTGQLNEYDIFIVDQLSTCVPLLHVLGSGKILFYCHFPDMLLAQRNGLLKRMYRIPFDLFEQFTISAADKVIVNSRFTQSIYKETFKFLKKEPDIIYPCVDSEFPKIGRIDRELLSRLLCPQDKFFLSINRFERKKNITLALKAFAASKAAEQPGYKLFICGGYDERVTENVEYLKELEEQAEVMNQKFVTISYREFEKSKNLENINVDESTKVIFLTSISSSLKGLLLSETELLLYTPSNEHFGIVPIEAMKYGKPVLAVNNGGPKETIFSYRPGENDKEATGWLRPAVPQYWGEVLNEFFIERKEPPDFSETCKSRVKKLYSRDVMTWYFEESIDKIVWQKKKVYAWEGMIVSTVRFLVHLIILWLFPGQSALYLLLAILSVTHFKDYLGVLYWLGAFLFSNKTIWEFFSEDVE